MNSPKNMRLALISICGSVVAQALADYKFLGNTGKNRKRQKWHSNQFYEAYKDAKDFLFSDRLEDFLDGRLGRMIKPDDIRTIAKKRRENEVYFGRQGILHGETGADNWRGCTG